MELGMQAVEEDLTKMCMEKKKTIWKPTVL